MGNQICGTWQLDFGRNGRASSWFESLDLKEDIQLLYTSKQINLNGQTYVAAVPIRPPNSRTSQCVLLEAIFIVQTSAFELGHCYDKTSPILHEGQRPALVLNVARRSR